MWPVSDAFRAAVRQSHNIIIRAEVWVEDSKIANLYPVSGRVSIDSRRSVRRTVSLTLVDEDGSLVPGPGGTTGILSPFGTEMRLFRGVRFPSGVEEYAPLGVFLITGLDVNDQGGGIEIGLEGSDRSIRIARNLWRDPYTVTTGTALEDAIAGILRDRWADVPVDLPTTGETTGKSVYAAGSDADPWKAATLLAESFGFDLAFDADGVARMRRIPDPAADDPSDVYEDGEEAVLLEVSRAFDSQSSYNGVIASSESSDVAKPVRAEAWDEDPNSPTYRYGPFGEVPLFYSSSEIKTAAQAATAAEAMLQKELGRAEAVEWSQVVNPAHDVLDVVRIVRPAAQLDAVLLIDRLEVPLDATSSMRAVARVREV